MAEVLDTEQKPRVGMVPILPELEERATSAAAIPLSPGEELEDAPAATIFNPEEDEAVDSPAVQTLGDSDELESATPAGEMGLFDAISDVASHGPNPITMTLRAMELDDRAKESEAEVIRHSLPDTVQFDPDSTFTGGMSGMVAQTDIVRNDSLVNKQKKFMSYFPEGQLVQVPVSDGTVLLARENRSEPFRKLALVPKVAGAVFSEATVLGTLGSVSGPTLTGVGTAAGSMAEHQIEAARGYPEPGSGIGGALIEGTLATGVDVASRGAARIFLGRASTTLERQALERAFAVADELNLEPLVIGQTGRSFIRKTFHQVGQTANRVERLLTKQQETLLKRIRAYGDNIPQGTPDAILEDVIRAQHKELSGLLNVAALGRDGAGEALQTGVETYKKASARLRDRYYKKAIDISDGVTFNLAPAKTVAQEISTGVLGRGLQQRAATGQFSAAELVRMNEEPTGQLASVLRDLEALNPKVTKVAAEGGEWTAFEQIKALRTRLFDLRNSSDGEIRKSASRLYKTLSEVMDNPVTGNPKFLEAYHKASGFNRLREQTLELSFVGQAIRTDTPENLAKRYFTPGHSRELATIEAIIPRPRWEEFRRSFTLDLANMPTAARAINRLNTFSQVDPTGFRMLLSQTEERGLRTYLTRRAQFEASPARKILNRTLSEGEQFVQMAKEGTAGEIADAIRISGGPKGSYGMAAKAGVFKDILDHATVINKSGIEVISPSKLQESIQDWLKSGKLGSIMTPDDVRRLSDIGTYTSIMSEVGDIGGGMMRGTITQQFLEAPSLLAQGHVGKAVTAARKWFANDIAAWILAHRSYLGRVREDGGLPLRETAVALTIAEHQLEQHESAQ